MIAMLPRRNLQRLILTGGLFFCTAITGATGVNAEVVATARLSGEVLTIENEPLSDAVLLLVPITEDGTERKIVRHGKDADAKEEPVILIIATPRGSPDGNSDLANLIQQSVQGNVELVGGLV